MVLTKIKIVGLETPTRIAENARYESPKSKRMRTELNKRQAEFIQRAAKLRAPRWSGNLIRSIVVMDVNDKFARVVANAPYSAAVELGYKPHWVSLDTSTRAGQTVRDWANSVGFVGISNSIFARKWSQGARFMEGALISYRTQSRQILSQVSTQIIKP